MRSLSMHVLSFLGIALCVALFAQGEAQGATTYTWNGGVGAFNVAGNWSPAGGPPGSSDTAIINTPGSVVSGTAANVASLTIGNGCSVTITSGSSVLTIGAGGCTIASGGNLLVQGISDSINGGGTITVNGAMTIDAATDSADPIIVNSGGILTLSNNGFINNPGSLMVNAGGSFLCSGGTVATLNNYTAGTSTLSGGSFTLTGVLNTSVNLITTTSANISLGSVSAIFKNGVGADALASLATISAGGGLTVGGGANFNTAAAGFTNAGTLTIAAGSIFNITGAGDFVQTGGTTILLDTLMLQSGNTVKIQGGTFSGSGFITGNLLNGAAVLVPAGQTLNVTGTYTQTAAGTYTPQVASAASAGLIAATGPATLAGAISPVIGYSAAVGNTYQLLTFGSATGSFSSINSVTLGAGLELIPQTAAGSYSLKVVTATTPVISAATASDTMIFTGTPITFNAAATDPNGLPLTFTWNFGDGSPPQTGTTVTYTYTTEGVFTATLTVSDPSSSSTATITIFTFAANSGAAGQDNAGDGTTSSNPENHIGIGIDAADGGVLTFDIDISGFIPRDAMTVSSDITEIGSRSSPILGTTFKYKFTDPGVYVATTTVSNSASNALGMARKTVCIGGYETGQPPAIKNKPKNSGITTKTIKGKFFFSGTNQATTGSFDTVTFGGSFELPEGLDLSKPQTMNFAIGNVIDSIVISPKGKGVLPSTLKRIKSVTVKYPKIKGGTTTAASSMATFTITVSEQGMSAGGFNTEGITNQIATSEKSLKSIPRTIQVAMVFGGVVWQTDAKASFKLSSKGDSGAIGTR